MNISSKLVEILADGRFHSGTSIAEQLGVSRAAIWKHIGKLKEFGLNVFCVTGKGYKIPGGLDLLDKQWLADAVIQRHPDNVRVDLFDSIASTNQFLIDSRADEKFHFCLSEYQYAGRGRLGRQWHSPFARNIYLSVKCQLPLSVELSGLSLAVGVWVAELIEQFGCRDIQVKWPNDLLIHEKKVGGILTELSGFNSDYREVTVGLGLNWAMATETDVNQSWINLGPLLKGISRNQLVLGLIEKLINEFSSFEHLATESFIRSWERFDFLSGKRISIKLGKKQINGNYRGIDESGLILVENQGQTQAYSGGEVSVRAIQ